MTLISNKAGRSINNGSRRFMNRLWPRLSLGLFPLLAVLFLTAFWICNHEAIIDPGGATRKYLNSAFQGNLGFGNAGLYGNKISFAGLEPGDIVLGGYPDCAYGLYSHAGIYMGDNRVAEAYADLGVCVQPLGHFSSYSRVCLLRVEAPAAVKKRAVDYVKKQQGGLFYPIAFKPGERFWNCSKIMWKAYADQGLDLDVRHDIWICPESFRSSPHVRVIRETNI